MYIILYNFYYILLKKIIKNIIKKRIFLLYLIKKKIKKCENICVIDEIFSFSFNFNHFIKVKFFIHLCFIYKITILFG